MSNEADWFKWLWTFLSVPLAWLWHRVNRADKVAEEAKEKANHNRVYIAEHFYTRPEIHDLVDRSVEPIHHKLDEIRDDLKYLVRKDKED